MKGGVKKSYTEFTKWGAQRAQRKRKCEIEFPVSRDNRGFLRVLGRDKCETEGSTAAKGLSGPGGNVRRLWFIYIVRARFEPWRGKRGAKDTGIHLRRRACSGVIRGSGLAPGFLVTHELALSRLLGEM